MHWKGEYGHRLRGRQWRLGLRKACSFGKGKCGCRWFGHHHADLGSHAVRAKDSAFVHELTAFVTGLFHRHCTARDRGRLDLKLQHVRAWKQGAKALTALFAQTLKVCVIMTDPSSTTGCLDPDPLALAEAGAELSWHWFERAIAVHNRRLSRRTL